MRQIGCAVALGIGIAATAFGDDTERQDARRPVDLAICLDTSGSMSGLIDAARRKLWDITNELAMAKPVPRLRVALLTYGNTSHDATSGWVRIDSAFTDDLDAIYQQLFALTTSGGTEYVGRVIQTSLDRLAWTPSNDALKLLFVAGNESADQDRQVPFREVCRRAIGQGIQVNSIYCGSSTDNIAPGWREVAQLADGQFASIDHNRGTVEVATPYDKTLQTLSTDLNKTYIAYGRQGQAGAARQVAQDANAASLSAPAAATRAEAKASQLYNNSRWDLVDAVGKKTVDLDKAEAEKLPESMRTMTIEERKAYVAEMAKKRADIRKQIADLSAKRNAYIRDHLKGQGLNSTGAFDTAVRKALRTQAEKKGFSFE